MATSISRVGIGVGVIAGFLLLLLAAAVFFRLSFTTVERGIPSVDTPIPGVGEWACTMEAKLCPDGSAVSRSGPRCEFAPCPGGVAR
ncbi:MAG: hypothetical protein WAT81_00245 [Candidatus Moraniibacteriota bacterium]